MKFTREQYDRVKTHLSLNPAHVFYCEEARFSIQPLLDARKVITQLDIPVVDVVIDASIWNLFLEDTIWHHVLDPMTDAKQIGEGQLATLFGMRVLSDAQYEPEHKFMRRGEILFIGHDNRVFSSLQVLLEDRPKVAVPSVGMSYSDALRMIKQGKLLQRKGWNGKGMFVFLVNGSEFAVNRAPLNTIFAEGTQVKYQPHLDMKMADGSIMAWNPNNADQLNDDWQIVESADQA